MRTIVLQGVSPEQLFSPEPLERLLAEKTLSYNAGILHGLQVALYSGKGRPARSNRERKSHRRTLGSGRRHTKI
jgi:hypothetical protein